MEKKCTKCGVNNPDGAKFCLACGSPVSPEPDKVRFCMRCGAALPAGAKYCLQCGCAADIPAAAAPAIAASADANPPVEAAAEVKPVEVPEEARTADMLQSRYRRSKAIRNVVLAIPILAYVIVLITHYHGLSPVLSDIRDYFMDGTIRDGFVVTAFAIGFILPFWIISEAIIHNRRHEAIREAGIDSIRFRAALSQYKNLKREGKLRPVADPGPIPEEVLTAAAIRSRYRRRSATSQIILYAVWLLLILLPDFLPYGEVYVFFDRNALYFIGFSLLYTICHFAVIIPLLRRKRKKECQKAGFDAKRFLELLYLYKTLRREKKQWAAQESARKQREEMQAAAERLAAAKPAQDGAKTRKWLIIAFILILIGGMFMTAVLGGSNTRGANRTLDGLYIDSEGMKNLTLGVNLAYPPELILFTSGGDVYFSQYDVVHSDAEMKQYGNHYTYKISGNTITIADNSQHTGTIHGDSFDLVGKTFVRGKY